jgi:hypothetical protein
MKTWLIINTAQLAAIQTINSEPGNASRQLSPVELTDGRYVLNPDLLTDCGEEGTWGDYETLLNGLAQSTFDITPLLPQPASP